MQWAILASSQRSQARGECWHSEAGPERIPTSAENPGNLVPRQALVNAVGHLGVEPTVSSKRGVLAQRGRSRAHPNPCRKSREPGAEPGPGGCSGPSWRRVNGPKQEGSAGTARPVPSASQHCGKFRRPGTEPGLSGCSGPSWRRANVPKQEGSAGTARPVPSASQPLRKIQGTQYRARPWWMQWAILASSQRSQAGSTGTARLVLSASQPLRELPAIQGRTHQGQLQVTGNNVSADRALAQGIGSHTSRKIEDGVVQLAVCEIRGNK